MKARAYDDCMDETRVDKGRTYKKDFIKKNGRSFEVHSESGKLLGSHPDKESAKKQLAAIEINKHK